MLAKRTLVLTVVLSVFLSTSLVFAQPMRMWKGSGGWGMGSKYQGMYDPKTIESLSGEVVNVDKITPMKGMHYGVHVQLKTEKETLSVHLGPGWYIERLDTKIEKGDKIEVKGARVTMMGQPSIIAAEIKKGDNILKLRDENGIPVWAGWRK